MYHTMMNYYAINLVVIQVNWTVSHVLATEGGVAKLSGTAFGLYANPIAIGVYCNCECSHYFSSGAITGMDIVLYMELV